MKRLKIGMALLAVAALGAVGTSSVLNSGAHAQSGYFDSGYGQSGVGYFGAYTLGQRGPVVNLNASIPWYMYYWSPPAYEYPWTNPPVAQTWSESQSRFAITRTSDSIEVKRGKDNSLTVKWQGEQRAVQRITLALLDAKRTVVTEKSITQMPAETTVAPTEKTKFYRYTIEYIDGTTTVLVAPL